MTSFQLAETIYSHVIGVCNKVLLTMLISSRDIIDVLVTCKYEEYPIKNEGANVLTRLYDVFSDAQGQLTPKSAAEFCRNSNSSKLL